MTQAGVSGRGSTCGWPVGPADSGGVCTFDHVREEVRRNSYDVGAVDRMRSVDKRDEDGRIAVRF